MCTLLYTILPGTPTMPAVSLRLMVGSSSAG